MVELRGFRANISEAGYASFGARVGKHGDWVVAPASACLWLTRRSGVRVSVKPLLI
jgi:hypothetical protein